jgi:sulfite exporter TauE/SafE
MWTWFSAIFVASLLGSFHCVCMCGPIAIWSGRASDSSRATTMLSRVAGYHLGRLLTYLVLGALAGVVGGLFGRIGEAAGVQSAAAKLVGILMVLVGAQRLVRLWRGPSAVLSAPQFVGRLSSWIAKSVASLRPRIAKLPIAIRSASIGAVTVLLPCGWLYLFVLLAAGSGSVQSSMLLMLAFWLGTLPALSALVAGALRFDAISGRSMPRLMPTVGAAVLILFGLHTATGRANADLQTLETRLASFQADEPESLLVPLESLVREPLPCCHDVK